MINNSITYAGSVNDRMDVIMPLIRNGRILDMGVVDSRREKRDTKTQIENKVASSLFKQICDANSNTMGVDIDSDGVEILRKQGFDTQTADVVSMDLGEQFDTIVAGEIIEHLPNTGMFLENMARHLKNNGTLVITTPNPFYSKQSWKIWRYNKPSVHEEHTCWFDPITLTYLCRLSGLEPYEVRWVQHSGSPLKALPAKFRDYFSHSFIVLARRAGDK